LLVFWGGGGGGGGGARPPPPPPPPPPTPTDFSHTRFDWIIDREADEGKPEIEPFVDTSM